MAQQIKKKFIQDDAVDGLKILLQQDQDLRRILGDGSTQDVIAYLEGLISTEEGRALAAEAGLETRISDLETQVGDDLQSAISQLQAEIAAETSARQSADTNLQSQITSLQGVDNVYFEDNSSVYADATAPVEDPSGRDGWYYKSAGSPDKVNWYFHDGTATPITVGQWENLYTVATVDSSSNDTFHLSYYTIAQGDGNDAGSWYRSRIVYVPQNGFARGVKTLFYMGQEPDASLYPDLPRVQMIESTVPGSSIGPNEDSESILTVVFGTNSTATAGSVELLVNKLGIQSSVFSAEYSLEIRGEFTLSGIKQSIFEEASARQAADTQIKEYKPDQVIYVSKNGDDSNSGSEQLPFLTLGAALASISDASPTKRYAIRISSGTYAETSISLKPNVFIVGENAKEAVRIDSTISMDAGFSGAGDHRSGFANVLILQAASFDWSSVTSAAGKLYFSQTVFGSTVNLYGHDNATAQAQFADCQFFGKLTISGINVSVFHNNICWSDVQLNQHPNGGMATIFNAVGGSISGELKLVSTVDDFNRRCSAFLKSCFTSSIVIDGVKSYVDVTNDSLPAAGATILNSGNLVRLNDEPAKRDLSNLSFPTAVNQPIIPANTNATNMGDWGKQWFFNFAYVHGSTGSDLYVISTMASYDASGDSSGKSIFIQADSYGLKENVNGGNVTISTAATTGTGVRGKISLDAQEVDVNSKQIKNLADGSDSSDAVNKNQLDAASSSLQSQITTEKDRVDAILLASEADKDSFAEIVSLINSVDTENDQAFAAYVSSNNSRVDALEAKGFAKGSQVVGAELAYIDLDREYETMLSVSVGRLSVHEGEDYTVSVVGGVTRLTWIGSLVNPGGAEAIETGDKVFWSGSY